MILDKTARHQFFFTKMKEYILAERLPLYDMPGQDEPDARVALAKLLLDWYAYLFEDVEVRMCVSVLFPFLDEIRWLIERRILVTFLLTSCITL